MTDRPSTPKRKLIMESLKIQDKKVTLVDQVEQSLIEYFRVNNLVPGDSIPNEVELTAALGVGRAVLREALSRFKMTGMIETRTRRGMILAEPSILGGMKRSLNPLLLTENTVWNLLEFRIALEVGISGLIFRNLTDENVAQLRSIVEMGVAVGHNKYAPVSEYEFHTKLYEITRNSTIKEFQEIIHPVLEFVKNKFKDIFEPIQHRLMETSSLVTHADLLHLIERRDEQGYKQAIEEHFKIYTIYLESRRGESVATHPEN